MAFSTSGTSGNAQNSTGIEQITMFIDMLLQKVGLFDIPEEERNAYRARLYEQIVDRLGAVAISRLSGEDIAEMAVKTEEGAMEDPGAIVAFYQQKIPDFPMVMQQALIDFGKEFLKTAAAISGKDGEKGTPDA